jgi:hypothetical protein
VPAFLAAHLSFGVVERLLFEAYEVQVSAEMIRQVAEAVGAEAREWEERKRTHYEEIAPLPTKRKGKPQTWVIECDGKQVGLQDGRWQEVKIGVIYELGARGDA